MEEGTILTDCFYDELEKVSQAIEDQQSAQSNPAGEEGKKYFVCPNCAHSIEATAGEEAPKCGKCGTQMVESKSKQSPAGAAAGE